MTEGRLYANNAYLPSERVELIRQLSVAGRAALHSELCLPHIDKAVAGVFEAIGVLSAQLADDLEQIEG